MLTKTSIAVGATVFLAACTTTGSSYQMSEEVASKLAKFERTGDVESCVPLRSTDIDPLDERNFLVETLGGDYFLNELPSSCNGADDINTRLQIETTLSSLCRNEIIRVVDNSTGTTVGSCGLGGFERLVKIEDAD